MPSVLAFDLGASSGRAIIGHYDAARRKLAVEEIHRFPNDPVRVHDRLHWDILRLFHEIKQGILQAKKAGHAVESLAIDSWAVDFGLIGANGELLANPYHYRDRQVDGIMEEVTAQIGRERIFASTGLQFLPFNTIYQLVALKRRNPRLLTDARKLLMIPDLLRYFLTGEQLGEYTNATTTQLLGARSREWDAALLAELGLPAGILPEIVPSGTKVGRLAPSVCEELGVPAIPVIAVGEHDTASAVAAVPAKGDEPFAYLSSGTWSLMGTETAQPVLSEAALRLNFTNEGGVYDTFRVLKNIMGLWLVQECRRCWAKEGRDYTYAQLVELAEEAEPFRSLIDPDHPGFLNPPHMPGQIRDFCRSTGQPEPETPGQMIRCVLESLALKYRMVLEWTEKLAGTTFSGLHIVGGGIHNELLCQFTADAINRPVWAGPAEASAIGNIAVQYIALGYINGLKEAREIIGRSFPLRTYKPRRTLDWQQSYAAFRALVEAGRA